MSIVKIELSVIWTIDIMLQKYICIIRLYLCISDTAQQHKGLTL